MKQNISEYSGKRSFNLFFNLTIFCSLFQIAAQLNNKRDQKAQKVENDEHKRFTHTYNNSSKSSCKRHVALFISTIFHGASYNLLLSHRQQRKDQTLCCQGCSWQIRKLAHLEVIACFSKKLILKRTDQERKQ